MIHGGELVTDGVEDHDQVVSSIDLVVELRDALGHVEQKLSTHRLEARSRKVVLQIPRVYLDRLADLLRLERISHVVDQIRKHTVGQRPHRLVHRQTNTKQKTHNKQHNKQKEEKQAEVEVD